MSKSRMARGSVCHRSERIRVQALGVVAAGVGEGRRAMVTGQNSQSARLRIHFSQTVFQPRQLGRADAALVVPGGVVGVEHDDAHMLGVDDDICVAAGNLLGGVAHRATLCVSLQPDPLVYRMPRGHWGHLPGAAARKLAGAVDKEREGIRRFEPMRTTQCLARTHCNVLNQGLWQCSALPHVIVIARKAGPGETKTAGLHFSANTGQEVFDSRVALWLPGICHFRVRAPEWPGTLTQFAGRIMDTANRRQVGTSTGQNGDAGIQLVLLGVVDVVPGADSEIKRTA